MIELTTAFDPGDIAAGDYTHVRIQSFRVDLVKQVIALDTLFGTLSGEDFVAGVDVPRATRKRFHIQGDDYAAMITKLTSAADVLIYDEVARELYQFLIDQGHFAGTVV